MIRTTFSGLAALSFFSFALAEVAFADTKSTAEAVTCRDGKAMVQSGGDWAPLTKELSLPHDITVTVATNLTFRVKEGKERRLKEGQILRADGNLLSPDGSLTPVFDHIAMDKGKVIVFRDGDSEELSSALTFSDGTVLNPDGTYQRKGRRSRLVDGQLLTLEGDAMPSQDTVTLSKGKVVVFKDGATLTLSPPAIMGFTDGTRVSAEGLVTAPDGTTSQLTEGQTITIEGRRTDW